MNLRTLSKGEFAAEVGVSAARVSQWIAEGKIGPDCLVGEGRRARVIVEKAKEQVLLRRDPAQANGNGIGTRLFGREDSGQEVPRTDFPTPPRADDVAAQLQQEKLDGERRRNRSAAREEAVALGQLVPTDQVRAEMTKLARQVDEENGAMLSDFAAATASRFGLAQRDVLHLLRQVRNEKKAAAAARARARAELLPDAVTVVIEGSSGT